MVVALDTTRLGGWEVWMAGIVVAGRTLPIGWAVLPYPWPKAQFRSTTLRLPPVTAALVEAASSRAESTGPGR